MTYQPIENYGVIGDLHTVALVGMDGSIDFMCFPQFDSASIFAALLDDQKGGRFQIAPLFDDAKHRQLYLPDSNILLSRFLSNNGVAEISDFMPINQTYHAHTLVRRAKTVRGQVRFRMLCAPRFNYARSRHRVEQKGNEVIFRCEGGSHPGLRLRASVDVEVHEGDAITDFTLAEDESASFVLEYLQPDSDGQSPSAATDYVSSVFKETSNYWRQWIGQSVYSGRWREMVNRSALTLKMLVSQPHGAIVASPTFGLPETLGGHRNWDYRYTWVRDASFTIHALLRLGYTQEAGAFMRWIEGRCEELEPDGALQVMYATDGRHDLSEEVLDHLEGYRHSSPVRIGNAAHKQLQLDIYGELMDAVYLYNKFGDPISYDLWRNLQRLASWVAENWNQADEGIWEVRGGRHHFLYSRLMCWVAIDRAIRLARRRSFPAPLDEWRKVRDEIYNDIFRNFWNVEIGAFMQYKGGSALDAASLMMPLSKFISPTDPRWLSTLRAIEEHLVDDSLVFRYGHRQAAPDGLEGQEGTFCMCSFWFVECLSRAGDPQKARFYFEKMLGYANHLGLYAEELGPRGEHLGNFPQAFTHLGLISAACHLDRELSDKGYD